MNEAIIDRMMRSKYLFVLFLLPLTACFVTRSQGDQMRADINRLKDEISVLQRERNDLQRLIEKRINEINLRTITLEKNSFKQNADSGLEKERLVTELQQLRGQLEETQHRLQEINQPPVKANETASNNELPANKAEHFVYAKKFYDDKQFEAAIPALDAFIERYKDDQQFLSQVFFLRGDAYFSRAKAAANDVLKKDLYKKAVLSFQEVLTRFPSSSKVPETLSKVGNSLEAMGYPKDAVVFYEEIVKIHPKSTFVSEAKKKLEKLSPTKKTKTRS